MHIAGSIKLEPLKRSQNRTKITRLSFRLADTLASQAVNIPEAMQNPEVRWHRGKHVISHADDECVIGTWIFAQSPFSSVRNPFLNIFRTSLNAVSLDCATSDRENPRNTPR